MSDSSLCLLTNVSKKVVLTSANVTGVGYEAIFFIEVHCFYSPFKHGEHILHVEHSAASRMPMYQDAIETHWKQQTKRRGNILTPRWGCREEKEHHKNDRT